MKLNNSDRILLEYPHVKIGKTPNHISFLSDCIIDVGIEDMKITREAKEQLYKSFISSGVKIPFYNVSLSNDGFSKNYDNTMPSFLPDWLSYVVAINADGDTIFVGHNVRRDRKPKINSDNFENIGDGYLLHGYSTVLTTT